VAIDIHLEAARAVGEEEMLAFFGRAADATLMDPDGSRYLRTPGMDITPFAVDRPALTAPDPRANYLV